MDVGIDSTLRRERVLFGGLALILSGAVIVIFHLVFQARSLTEYLLEIGLILGFLRFGMLRPITDPVERSVHVLRSAFFLAVVPAASLIAFIELQEGPIGGDNVFRFGLWMTLALAGLYVLWSDGPWEREREELEKIKDRYREDERSA